MDKLSLLDIPLFSGLDRVDRAKILPELDEISYKAGDTLFHSGDYGDSLYIISEGTVSIILEKGDEIRRLGKGECFGEMSLLTGSPRSAEIQAVTDIIVLRLSKHKFDNLLERHHSLAVYFAGLLAKRRAAVIYSSAIGNEPDLQDKEDQTKRVKTLSSTPARRLLENKKLLALALVAASCILLFMLLEHLGLKESHAILTCIVFGATVLWALNIFSPHVISFSMPVLAVIFHASGPDRAFSGFSSPSWFLILGVLAITAAISKTGLMYRLALIFISFFPASYIGQTLAWTLAGTLLTPVIPSSNGRAALVSPMLLELIQTLRLKPCSQGSAGLAMSCLLGFGHMSVLFMNGAAVCYLVYGLLPPESATTINYGYWFKAALPMSLVFLILSYCAIIFLYRHNERLSFKPEVIKAQLKLLGPLTIQEKLALLAIAVSLLGFMTEGWHHVNGAWISLISFLVVYGSSVLKDQDVRSEIDWNLLISFGALIGFGNALSSSGLTNVISKQLAPYLQYFIDSKLLFLLMVVIFMVLLRLFLPITPALVVTMLSIAPFSPAIGISPFVVGLVALLSANTWFFPHQNIMYLTILYGTKEELFRHDQAVKASIVYVVICLAAVSASIPFWRAMGLL
ncbi:MAG: SLC13 family permease [Desulfocucumaceae bacterium]